MTDKTETPAQADPAQADPATAAPQMREVHADPGITAPMMSDMPAGMKTPVASKSPARWAYERLILYIQNFEKQLDGEHEVAMGFAGGDAGVLKIEGMGYFDPDIVTFFGSDAAGTKTQLIQHVSQLAVILRALPKTSAQSEPTRIGFKLAAELAEDAS